VAGAIPPIVMTETDVLALANFLVSHENLLVNYKILEVSREKFEQGRQQGLMLEEIISLLKEKIQ